VRARLAIAAAFIMMAALAAAQTSGSTGISKSIDSLSAFDYSPRVAAARALRRVPAPQAVPALVAAARGHRDEFVRYRALVLLTAFNDRGTGDLMRSLLADRNDRVREVAYRWFATHPDASLQQTLLAALQTEQAEFVRPAMIAALAAVGSDPQVQRALVAEAGRGLDFFRVSVIEALGDRRAAYAVDALGQVAKQDGPLQDDAVLALGRIGEPKAREILRGIMPTNPEVTAALHAASCLLGDDCPAHLKELVTMATGPGAWSTVGRGAMTGLIAVAASVDSAALDAVASLADTGIGRMRDDAAVALGIVSVRAPARMLSWLEVSDEARRDAMHEHLKAGFERLEDDFGEEQFFAAARAAYWAAPEASPARVRIAALIDKLEF
jgi:HEAT repeat protein